MINYGIVYGLSAWGMADRLDIPQEEAEEFIQRYMAGFPAVGTVDRGDDRAGHRARLRLDPVRPAPAGSRAARAALGAAQAGRAVRGQHGDPGDRRRHHEGGDGPLRPGAEAGRAALADDPPDPRRAAVRGTGRGSRGGQADRRRADGRRHSRWIRRWRSRRASGRTGWPRSEVPHAGRRGARRRAMGCSGRPAAAQTSGQDFGGVAPRRAGRAHLRRPSMAGSPCFPTAAVRVLHSNRTHVIFWQPSGSGLAFDPGYAAAIEPSSPCRCRQPQDHQYLQPQRPVLRFPGARRPTLDVRRRGARHQRIARHGCAEPAATGAGLDGVPDRRSARDELEP